MSVRPTKPWLRPRHPTKSAAGICDYAECLRTKNFEVALIDLVAQLQLSNDVGRNELLQWFVGCRYLGPRKLLDNHFLREQTRENVQSK